MKQAYYKTQHAFTTPHLCDKLPHWQTKSQQHYYIPLIIYSDLLLLIRSITTLDLFIELEVSNEHANRRG